VQQPISPASAHCQNINSFAGGLSLAVTQMILPPHLYKYFALNERTISVLVNSVIYFSHADGFNDPFDCRIRLSYDGRKEEWKAFFRRKLREYSPHLATAEIESMIDQKIGQLDDEKFLDDLDEEVRRGHLSKSSVLCLSDAPAQILMWSHYADAHRGCCLQFSTKQKLFGGARRVHYPRRYPNVRFLDCVDDHAKFVHTTYLTKSKLWKYEKEWRVIGDEPGLYSYNPDALIGIIFGSRMKPEHQDLIRRLARMRKTPLRLYRAEPWKRDFKMQIFPLS
jgi:Protein of unknown function (DUF2971)